MNNLELIQSFGKGESGKKVNGKNAIIYTRVSSKEQTENLSLDVQLKGCENFALKNHLLVKGRFGGTYESAQTDERIEFQRMVNFAKNYKEGISYIIVYSLERFSRTGENAIWLSRQLRELGIAIFSVTQPIDTSNPSGVLQQNILFLFSQYDNDLRRQKCVDGMREKLLKGEWVGVAPRGYSYDRSGSARDQKIVINNEGQFIRKIFELKVYDNLSNTQICDSVAKMGFQITMQRLCEVLRNPFYCGFISNKLLEGQVVKGKHQAIISEELFLQANELIKKNLKGIKLTKIHDSIPLKQFVLCAECGTPFTGYIVKKKNLWYYKCNKLGCSSNKSANHLHKKFEELLDHYTLDKMFIQPVIEYLEDAYSSHAIQLADESKAIKSKITELTTKLDTIEERFALGETDRAIYEKISSKLKQERRVLEGSLEGSFINLSNPAKVISETVEFTANLKDLWVSGSAIGKHNMQKLLFPDGIQYDRKIDHYRTSKVNEVIKVIDSFSMKINPNKKDRSKNFVDLSSPVASTGIEPVSKV